MSQQVKVPSRIDDPHHFLFWQVDEVAPWGLVLMLGIWLDHLGKFLLFGFVLVSVYKRFRDGRPDGYFLHLLYWLGFVRSRGRSMPNPFVRRFFP
ncbi:MAG: type IV conjugative transfer system protein TraL [Alphaproteobacteria bacterium]|nr:type IV conjugative transfer system protein TraL [Alphaproteobacteria bacterium]